jgi:hypothetical protein
VSFDRRSGHRGSRGWADPPFGIGRLAAFAGEMPGAHSGGDLGHLRVTSRILLWLNGSRL